MISIIFLSVFLFICPNIVFAADENNVLELSSVKCHVSLARYLSQDKFFLYTATAEDIFKQDDLGKRLSCFSEKCHLFAYNLMDILAENPQKPVLFKDGLSFYMNNVFREIGKHANINRSSVTPTLNKMGGTIGAHGTLLGIILTLCKNLDIFIDREARETVMHVWGEMMLYAYPKEGGVSSYLNYKPVMCFDVKNYVFIAPNAFVVNQSHVLDHESYRANIYAPVTDTIMTIEKFLKEKLEEVRRQKGEGINKK